MNPLYPHRPRPVLRLLRIAGIGLLALAFVLLLPLAPAQQRDLGAVGQPDPRVSVTPAAAAAAMSESLPYRPFIDPVRAPVHSRWYLLLLPMSFGVALVYKAVALHTLERYWHQVMYLTVQVIVGMILLAVASYLLVMIYVPWVAAA